MNLKGFLLSSIFAGAALAQSISPPPDCTVQFSFSATSGTTIAFDNRFIGCQDWFINYSTFNVSGLSVTVQSAPDAGGTPGTFVTFIGPISATPYGSSSATNSFVPWINITQTGTFSTGGLLNGALIGWKPGRQSSSSGAIQACVGTPGNTTAGYLQECATTAGAVYICNNTSGCTVAADWVAVSGSGSFVYPAAGVPQSTGAAWATSLTTSGSGTVLCLTVSCTMTTPALGTPSAVVLTNATGLPLTTGVTGLLAGTNGGTGVNNGAKTLTLGGNTAFTGAFNPTLAFSSSSTYTFPSGGGTLLINGGALGTPSSGVATNLTGLPLSTGVTGLLTGTNGGTGVNNGANTLTIGGNVTFSGAFNPTIVVPSSNTWTLPPSGANNTLVSNTTANNGTLSSSWINALASGYMQAPGFVMPAGGTLVPATGQIILQAPPVVSQACVYLMPSTPGTINGVLHFTDTCPSIGTNSPVDLAADVTGTLPAANGGTGGTTGAVTTVLDNISLTNGILVPLLSGSNVANLGSATQPFKNLFLYGGGTYGTTVVELTSVPTGNNVLVLPDASDTLVGRGTTDTLLGKTYNTAGAGNAFAINNQSITAVSGNTSTVGTVNGALTNGDCIAADVNGNLKDSTRVDCAVKANHSLTAQTASVGSTILCASAAGACNNAGQYNIFWSFSQTGTACADVTAGKVTLQVTWTDTNGTTRTVSPVMQGTGAVATTPAYNQAFFFQTALTGGWASGNMVVSSSGAQMNYATTYTACTTGTGTYQLDTAVARLQ